MLEFSPCFYQRFQGTPSRERPWVYRLLARSAWKSHIEKLHVVQASIVPTSSTLEFQISAISHSHPKNSVPQKAHKFRQALVSHKACAPWECLIVKKRDATQQSSAAAHTKTSLKGFEITSKDSFVFQFLCL